MYTYTFTKLHDRCIPNVGVRVRVGVGPVEFQLYLYYLTFTRASVVISVCTAGEVNSVELAASAGEWCRVTCHRYRDHVGTPGCYLPVDADSLHVFSDVHHARQGLCLSALRQPAPPPADPANINVRTAPVPIRSGAVL